MEIDLNCDLGEGNAHDADLLALVTSASVACGFHAGGPAEGRTALRLAKRHGVVAGAHPGHADRENFGRLELARSPEQVFEETVYQVGALAGLARCEGVTLGHLKPHGALYHQACRDDAYARPLVAVAELFGLALFGLPGSWLEKASVGHCRFVPEGFADRRYRPDGSLVPRDQPNAFVADPQEAATQARTLLAGGTIRTLCVHGDNPEAVAFVRALREALQADGVSIRPYVRS